MNPLSPNDVVPSLRSNVAFSTVPEGLGDSVLKITNIDNGEEVRVHGFEYSLARMLDGHRPAREVVEHAEQLGLPLTLAGLEGFLKKMASYDLVRSERSPAPQGEGSPWVARNRWDEPTREGFREALREARTGQVAAAVSTLDRVLEKSPEALEAKRLRDELEAREPTASPAQFSNVFAQTELKWRGDAQAERESPQPRRLPTDVKQRGAVALAAVVAIAIAAALVPFPRTVTVSAMLLPGASTRVLAPRTGIVEAVPVALKQRVEPGDVLFTYDATGTQAALEAAVARLEKLRHELSTLNERIPTARDAKSRYENAEAAVARAERRLERARTEAGDPFSEQVTVSEASLNWALQDLDVAHQALDALTTPNQRVTLKSLEAEVQELQKQLLDREVKAPRAGEIAALAVRPGEPVLTGMEVATLDDNRKLKAVVTLASGLDVEAGQQVLLVSRGRATQTLVQRTEGTTAHLWVDNTAGAFEPGAAEVQLRARAQPLLRWP